MRPTAEMIEAGARAICPDRWDWDDAPTSEQEDMLTESEYAITAAMPLIEQEVAEQIAERLEAEASDSSYRDRFEVTNAWLKAATVALDYAKEKSND